MLNLIMNILWVIFGGFSMAVGWWFAALLMAISIVGIPWARASLVMGLFVLWPFGMKIVPRHQVTNKHDIGTGAWGVAGNIIWFILAGWWLALGHVFTAICWFITIIGIPFGLQHLKFAMLALAPIGKTVVDKKTGEPLWWKF
ncbi:YccF domain-containing protein [Neisseriaceae bacterium ESL0693]|nr:YccF domain-containing protein [Neisseriaceae bacterium ESL0693]